MINEYKNKTVEELQGLVFDAHKKLLELKLALRSNQSSQTHEFKQVRREIARYKTLIHQKLGA